MSCSTPERSRERTVIQAARSLLGSGSNEGKRKWKLVQLVGATVLLVAAMTMVLTRAAGAAGPSEGSEVPGAIATSGTVTTGTPFSSGQMVNIVIPANSLFASTTNLD